MTQEIIMEFGDVLASAGPYANDLHFHSIQITTTTPHHSIFTGMMLFVMPNQHCQSIEGKNAPKRRNIRKIS